MRDNYLESICIVKVKDANDIYLKIKQGFSLIRNLEISPDDVVVIKPNLCAIKSSETGATTDPLVVGGIIRYLKNEYGVSDISIVESDGEQVIADMAFKLLGYERLSQKLNVKLVNLSRSSFSTKIFPNNNLIKRVRIPKILEIPNIFISVPKMKTHDTCLFTGTLKNQFGCNPYPRKSIYHGRLHDAIVDLYAAYKPNLVVVDALVAMEGMGPVNGIPVKMNSLFFGRDGVAVDYLIARTMGINPNKVRYLVESKRRGLGISKYMIVGRSMNEIQRKFSPPTNPSLLNLYGLLGNLNESL